MPPLTDDADASGSRLPTWAEIWSFGDRLRERERVLRLAGAFFEKANLAETDRLEAELSAMRAAFHERHAAILRLDFKPPAADG